MNNLLMQLTNEFKNLFITEDNQITPLFLTLLSGGLGAVITLIFTYFMTLARDKKQNKEQNRTYIIADEIDNLGARLEGYSNTESKELRIIETDNFIQLDDLVQKGHIRGESLNYLRLRNLGPAMLVQCDIQITIGSGGREDIEINKVIPLFLSNQELFVFAQSLENFDNPQLLKKVVIQYKTVANEGMKYVYDVRHEGDRNICREQYYVKTMFKYKLLNSVEVDQVSWVFVNHNRSLNNSDHSSQRS